MRARLIVFLAAALLSSQAVAFPSGTQVSAWTDFNKPRAKPTAFGAADWTQWLQRYGEGELDSSPGGRAYRLAFIEGDVGDPTLVRLDIAAEGRATVTTKTPGQPSRSANLCRTQASKPSMRR